MFRTYLLGMALILVSLCSLAATAVAQEAAPKKADCPACGQARNASAQNARGQRARAPRAETQRSRAQRGPARGDRALPSSGPTQTDSVSTSEMCICLFFKYAEYCIDPECSQRIRLYYGMYCAEGSGGTISYESVVEEPTGYGKCSSVGDCGHYNCFPYGDSESTAAPARTLSKSETVREKPKPFALQRGITGERVKKINKDENLLLVSTWQNGGSKTKYYARFVGDPIFADVSLAAAPEPLRVKLWLVELQSKEPGGPRKHEAYVGLGQEYDYTEATAPESRVQVPGGMVDYLGPNRSTNALLVTVGSITYSVWLHDSVAVPGK
jgi:hypothetical protein